VSSAGSRMASSVVCISVVTFACATSSRAQALPQFRDGFMMSGGIGAGVASVQCAVCKSGAGAAAYVRLGGALRRDLILAGEVSRWRKSGAVTSESQSDVRVQLSTLAMVAQWYPHVERGFFVDAGAGLGILETRIADRVTGTRYPSSHSAGYQLGVGYDYRVKRTLSITPYATVFGAAPSHMAESSKSAYGNALQIGLGLTQH